MPLGIDDVANDLVHAAAGRSCSTAATRSRRRRSRTARPTIYVSTTPAELIVFKGQPNFQPIGTTSLLWATNTHCRRDRRLRGQHDLRAALGALVSRRRRSTGPWSYVAEREPAGRRSRSIPPGSPAGVVLPAVAGTPQAREAVIENSIPQTASVPLANGPTFAASYDGAPQLAPIAGTLAPVRRQLRTRR